MTGINTSTAEQRERVLAALREGPRAYRRGAVHAVAGGKAMRIAAISSQIIFTMFTKFTRAGSHGFTSPAMEADNRGSLSIIKRLALAVIYPQGTSSRQIPGGLRMGAGGVPSSGVWGSRKAPAGLDAGESAPTRFRLSTKPCGNTSQGRQGPAGFSLNHQERANHA